MSDKPELSIIHNEIERLETQSGKSGLTLEDVKKLETLIKTRQLILGEPTEITSTKEAPKKKVSDKDVLAALKPKKKATRKRKAPVKKASDGKTKKTQGK